MQACPAWPPPAVRGCLQATSAFSCRCIKNTTPPQAATSLLVCFHFQKEKCSPFGNTTGVSRQSLGMRSVTDPCTWFTLRYWDMHDASTACCADICAACNMSEPRQKRVHATSPTFATPLPSAQSSHTRLRCVLCSGDHEVVCAAPRAAGGSGAVRCAAASVSSQGRLNPAAAHHTNSCCPEAPCQYPTPRPLAPPALHKHPAPYSAYATANHIKSKPRREALSAPPPGLVPNCPPSPTGAAAQPVVARDSNIFNAESVLISPIPSFPFCACRTYKCECSPYNLVYAPPVQVRVLTCVDIVPTVPVMQRTLLPPSSCCVEM